MKNFNRYILLTFISITLILACKPIESNIGTLVSNPEELHKAISNAQPGTTITMTDGTWNDIQIKFFGVGTKKEPITLQAETPGKVLITGNSDLKLGGEFLKVDGLYFTNGASPSRSVIQYYINKDTLANNTQVTNCVIKDFNKSQKNKQDLWVLFKGRHNELDHCYLAGKSNRGPTVRIELAGNESIKNYHKIHHNHFGPRPPKGGPSAETIQIGNSGTSMTPSHTQVTDNLFDRCNGEVEVISSKTNFNEFRNNVFYKSEGSLVTRHGNYCTVDGNYFIGDEDSPYTGGIRLIGSGHLVTNNYFYKLRGEVFRAPLAVMNGIKRSAINRYIQVTDVVVAYNTWIDCTSPWQFGVGSNVDQKGVLPASEIRSETPTRTIVANNVIYNSKGDPMPIFRHDSIDGITFKSNIINNQGVKFRRVKGLEEMDFTISDMGEDLWIPASDLNDVEAFRGFEFDKINKDLLGNSREDKNTIGAINLSQAVTSNHKSDTKYGPQWYDPTPPISDPKTITVGTTQALVDGITNAKDEDIIVLASGDYEINSPLQVDKKITIRSDDKLTKSKIIYLGSDGTPAFEMNPKGQLTLESVKLEGSMKNYAFASQKENMSSLYNLTILNTEIANFDYVLMAYKHSFSEYIEFRSTSISNCNNGIVLSSEDDDKGEYNAENLTVYNCNFEGIKKNAIDYYRGGYDESTVGGILTVTGSTFSKCGSDKTGILIKTHGIINVDVTENKFVNNKVSLIARLWGAKNNSESDNTISNSGKFITEQNLAQKLVY